MPPTIRAAALVILVLAGCAGEPAVHGSAAAPATAPASPVEAAVPAGAPDRLSRIRLPADRVERIALANVMHVLYHEVAHALIQELDIPILAREEDVADNLATLLFLAEKSPVGRNALLAVAQGWLDYHREDGPPDTSRFADEHSLHIQRYFQVICLLYGSDPAGEAATADEAGLEAERRESCIAEYEQIQSGWARVLRPHMAVAGAPPGGRVRVTWEEGRAAEAPAVAMLRRSLAVEVVAEDAARRLRLPHDFTIALRSCDDENAWWDGDERVVTYCYELVNFYARMATRIAASHSRSPR